MYARESSVVIKRLASMYPVIGITGPRQSGKTTTAKFLFPHLPYVSLEDLDVRLQAEHDPRTFLALYKDGAIFDEVQNAPWLLSYMQGIVDANPQPGLYVITGSQDLTVSQEISQSLAGRIGMVTLLPLSLHEIGEGINLQEAIFQGGYPALYQKNIHPLDLYPSYIRTYVERDIRQLQSIENLGLFQNFLKLCAGRIGQIVNFTSLAQDAGIGTTTAKQWLHILQASYIIFTLQPYYKNFSKRLIKMPKLYFYDTGLACSLLGLEKKEQVGTHYLQGGLFENLMILEVMKSRVNRGLPPNLYFWRDRTGYEIDLIGEWGGHIHAVEIKLGATIQDYYFKNLRYFIKLSKHSIQEPIHSYLLYTGSQEGGYLGSTLMPMHKLYQLLLDSTNK